MDLQRNFFIIILLFMYFIIWQTWKHNKNSHTQQKIDQITTTTNNSIKRDSFFNNGKQIVIKTDVLKLIINTYGGDIEQAWLLTNLKDLKSKEPFQLLETTPEFIYQAQNGLSGRDGPDNPENGLRPIYNVDKYFFTLSNEKNELVIPMSYKDTNKNIFIKTITVKRGEYSIDIDYLIKNNTINALELSNFGQLKQSISLPSYRNIENNNFTLHTFRGAAYSTLNEKYKKYKFDDIMNNRNLNSISKGGWIAMLQQYFITAWIPRNEGINNFFTTNIDNSVAAIGYKSQSILIQPGQIGRLKSTLWIGPGIQDKMAFVARNLDLTVDYGWLWFISQPLFNLLKFIHSFLNNWGFSIIVITLIVRGFMYPLTKAQYISIAKIRMLQPKIQAIRDRLGNDKERISQEIIALYKSDKVNPLGGCFPLLIQMPIFLALYYMLIGSVELRHASFALWIHDLSAQDPYYILPILMGITMFFIQKMSPNTVTDPTQKKIMIFMPVIFTFFFLWFPSGLVLYYIVSNLVTIVQQYTIYRSLEKRGLK